MQIKKKYGSDNKKGIKAKKTSDRIARIARSGKKSARPK